MSEYTNYYIVKSTSELKVKEKLNDAKIFSIVDKAKNDWWFLEKYKEKYDSDWIIVVAPADTGFKNGEFYYEEKFENLCKLFETVICFFEEENAFEWTLTIAHGKDKFNKDFYKEKNVTFTYEERKILENTFETNFTNIECFLKPGKSEEFLNFNGIPYQQMNDQNRGSWDMQNGNYSILSSEVED